MSPPTYDLIFAKSWLRTRRSLPPTGCPELPQPLTARLHQPRRSCKSGHQESNLSLSSQPALADRTYRHGSPEGPLPGASVSLHPPLTLQQISTRSVLGSNDRGWIRTIAFRLLAGELAMRVRPVPAYPLVLLCRICRVPYLLLPRSLIAPTCFRRSGAGTRPLHV